MITFNDIPNNLRIPGFYFEFDPAKANSGETMHKLLVLGQRLNDGSVAAAEPVRVTRTGLGEEFFGRGSMLATLLRYVFAAGPQVEVWAIALDDDDHATAATGTLTVTGAASVSGTIALLIGGEKVRVGVASTDSAATVAGAAVAAINARTDLPVTAAVNQAGQVDLTARNAGAGANDIAVDVLFEADSQPSSPTIAITPMHGGTGNPDIATAIAAMGDEWYSWIVCPWTDDGNLVALETELTSRFGPMRQIGGRAFTAVRGTYGTAAAFGDGRNCPHVTCIGTGPAPQPPYVWAAVNATVAANALSIDPARQLQGLVLPTIQPANVEDRFTFDERNLLLFDGISTATIDRSGLVRIEAQITMYQENAQGLADDSMLYINVPETYDAYRREMQLLFAPHARDKLADDGNTLPTGQPIMTPKKAEAMLRQFYRRMIADLGWCEDFDRYVDTLQVEKDGNRLKIVDQPNFVGNLRQLMGRTELVN